MEKKNNGSIIRISKETKERLNKYCIKRFRYEFQFISKDFLLKNLLDEFEEK